MKIILSWKTLSIIKKYPIFRISFCVLFFVPLLSRLSAASEDNNILFIINQLFDAKTTYIPINMLRLFYSAVFIIFGQLTYSIFCPTINEYEEWLKNEKAIKLNKELTLKHGKQSSNVIERKLKDEYDKEKMEDINSIPIVRFIIMAFYLISAYFIIRVFFDQLYLVISVTEIERILP